MSSSTAPTTCCGTNGSRAAPSTAGNRLEECSHPARTRRPARPATWTSSSSAVTASSGERVTTAATGATGSLWADSGPRARQPSAGLQQRRWIYSLADKTQHSGIAPWPEPDLSRVPQHDFRRYLDRPISSITPPAKSMTTTNATRTVPNGKLVSKDVGVAVGLMGAATTKN